VMLPSTQPDQMASNPLSTLVGAQLPHVIYAG